MRTKNRAFGSRLARMTVLALAGALALSGCDFDVYKLPLPGGADLGSHPYTVQAEFRDVLDLVPQSSVKVDDVTVGKVTDISVDGYHAKVTMALRDGVKLPDNAEAEIRQTSLLGEKFVSLAPPPTGASHNLLSDGDVIPLERTGRNPEVEEVLGAMSLLLNGGGVAQLKTISTELNKALSGRETDVRSVLDQLNTFMAQIDANKQDIVKAIESLNKLAISINQQRGSIEMALDDMPRALASINRQRDDLVKMLKALDDLSSVGTRVIAQSKTATIDSLKSLDPVLSKLAEAGDALPKAFQVFLTYPFVDEVVGRNPVQARNLHMGDYTNLSIQMDIDLTKGFTPPGLPGPQPPINPGQVTGDLAKCLQSHDPSSKACTSLTPKQQKNLQEACKSSPLNPVCQQPAPSGGGGNGGGSLPVPSLPGLGRAAPAAVFFGAPTVAPHAGSSSPEDLGYDATLGALLIQGMVQR